MSESSREKQLELVLHGYLQAVDAGQNPDRDELLRLHPDFADELRAFFADQSQMDRVAQAVRQAHVGDITIGLDQPAQRCEALCREFAISATTSCWRRSPAAAWASCSRPGK